MEQKQDLFNYYKNALSNGLCQEYKGRWQACHEDKEQLIKLALEQQSIPHVITYCNEGKGVSKEYLQKNYADYINGKAKIQGADGVDGFTSSLYVGYHGIFTLDTDVVAFLWTTNTVCTIKETKCPVMYFGCGSKVFVSLDGYNCPKLYLFDNSEVIINDADVDSKVVVYKYSKKAKVTIGKYCLAEVKVFDKELKL